MPSFDRGSKFLAIFQPGRPARKPKKRGRRALGYEALEVRLVPTGTSNWLGTAGPDWSTAANWDTPPTAGSNLVFPATASNLTNTDDLGAMTFGTLTIAGSGYSIGGTDTATFTSIDASQTADSSTVDLPIELTGAGEISVDSASASLVLGGLITGSVGLTKSGSGSVDLTADNTYSGATTISGGTLLVDGIQTGSAIAAETGTTFGGVGSVGTITATGAALTPGDQGAGVLTTSGNLSLGPDSSSTNSSYDVTIDGSTAGNGSGHFSQTQVAGSISLGGVNLNVSLGPDFTQSVGTTLTIIANQGSSPISGTFVGLPQGAGIDVSGKSFQISYDGGTNGNSVVLTEVYTSTTTVSPSTTAPVYGQSVTLTATVSGTAGDPTPTGSVEFLNGDTDLGTEPLTGGTATLETSQLALGANSITAVYTSTNSYAPSTSSPLALTVVQANTSTAVTYFPTVPVAGQNVTLTATVSPTSPGSGTPTGTVQFFNGSDPLGTANLTNGVATFTATTLASGANSISAQYEGDSDFVGNTSPVVTVTLATAATSTTAVTYSPSAPVYGGLVTLTATVSPVSPLTETPTGTVNFYNGTTLLGAGTLSDGTVSLAPLALPTGANSITAVYSGDGTFTGSTSPATNVAVATIGTSTGVSASPTSTVFGESVTLTATVTPDGTGSAAPTGSVTFFSGTTSLGSEPISNGVATLSTSALPAGTDAITAKYGGDTNYGSSTSAATTVTVSVADTTSVVTYFPTSPVAGQNVSLTATVSAVSPGAGTPTGTVDFYNGSSLLGSATLSNGSATFVTSALTAGANSITADYAGDPNFSTSTSSPVTVTPVATADSTTSVSASSSTPAYGASVTFTATVQVTSGSPTGTVNFYLGTTLLGSSSLSSAGTSVGTATLATTKLGVGANAITAQYSGDDNFTSSTSAAVTVTVSQIATSTAVTYSPSSPTVGANVTLTATITPSSTGSAVPTGTVDFFSGSTLLGSGTISNDVATYSTTALAAGSNSITAEYLGDTNYATSTSTAVTVTVTQFVAVTYGPTLPVYGQAVTLTATLTPTGTAAPTGTVTFVNGSTELGTATVSSDVATLNTTLLSVGNNAVTADYSGDSNYPASTSAVESVAVVLAATSTNVSLSDSNPALDETVTLTAIVSVTSPGAGNPTGTVEFLDNGTSLGTGTISGNQASISVVLPIGSNVITAQYSGDANFESSTATAATAVAGTANELWLNQVYPIELGRAATSSDFAYWDKVLNAGASRIEVVAAISDSTEAKLYRIQSAFQEYLGSDGTAAEIHSVVVRATVTHTSVRAAILGSSEFYAQSGGTPSAYQSALETAILGTTVDQPVLQSQLANGVSRTVVAEEVLQSNKGKQALLEPQYQAVLDNAPTNQQVVAYVGLMNDGVYLRTIVASLLAGSEFYNNATAALSNLSN